MRIRNARQSDAASDATQVSEHQAHIDINGECEKKGYLRGGGVKIADSRAYFRECVIHPLIPLSAILPAQTHVAFNARRVKTGNNGHIHADAPFSAKTG